MKNGWRAYVILTFLLFAAIGCWRDITNDPVRGLGKLTNRCIETDQIVFLTFGYKTDFSVATLPERKLPQTKEEYYGVNTMYREGAESRIVGVLPRGTRIRFDRMMGSDSTVSGASAYIVATILDGEYKGKTIQPEALVVFPPGELCAPNPKYAHLCNIVN